MFEAATRYSPLTHTIAATGGALLLAAAGALAGVPADLAPGHWYRVPDSRMDAVDPCPKRDCAYSGTSGQHSVMGSWGGGAFDTRRNRLLVWGGGHSNYGGNELYAFDVDGEGWLRLTEPSEVVADSVSHYPDGMPAARHTYGDLQYDPVNDWLVSLNAGSTFGSRGGSFRLVDVYDFTRNRWFTMSERPPGGTAFGNWSAYDPVSGRFFYHGSNKNGRLQSFDPATNRWRNHTNRGGVSIYMTAAVDTRRHRLVAVGANGMFVYDLKNPDRPPLEKISSGADRPERVSAPGFVYDPVSDRFVAWVEGADVYLLHPETWAWSRHPPHPDNDVVPSPPARHGTYGRFRYMPHEHAFILVNSASTDVYYYRLSGRDGVIEAHPVADAPAGAGPSDPSASAKPPAPAKPAAPVPQPAREASPRPAPTAPAAAVLPKSQPNSAGPDADWAARATAPGVLMATRFDRASEVTDWAHGSATIDNVSWDTSRQTSGKGSLRFAVLRTDTTSSGNWRRYLADDKRAFGAGDEFYVQYRQYTPAYLIEHGFRGKNFKGRYAQGFKSSIISSFRRSNTPFEVVIQNTGVRGYIQGYHQDGRSSAVKWDRALRTACTRYDYAHQPAIDRGPVRVGDACENDRARYGGLYSYQSYLGGGFGDPDPLTGAFTYPKDDWFTVLQRVRISPAGYTAKDNLIETWAARRGEDYVLLYSDDAVRFGGGGAFDTLWLLNYRSKGDSDPTRRDTFTNYDEVIVSSRFIPAPGFARIVP